jgi:cell division septation protein DedD
MASGGRRGASERVLESKHVIGLFLLMLLFSGIFFSLGYVMGRNQYDGQVRAAMTTMGRTEPAYIPKNDPAPKKVAEDTTTADSDPSTDSTSPAWTFPSTNGPANAEPHLDTPAVVKTPDSPAQPSNSKGKKVQAQPVSARVVTKTSRPSATVPAIPSGSYVIQVAALMRQDDALAIAGNLQKKHYSVYVQSPQKDKYYRVQVGPFKDQKSADAAKKGLEGEGFKAFYVKH